MVFQIKRSTVELYDGKGEPPSWKLTVQASSTDDTITDLNEIVTLTDNKPFLQKNRKWTIPITRMAKKPILTSANWVKSPAQFNNCLGNVIHVCSIIVIENVIHVIQQSNISIHLFVSGRKSFGVLCITAYWGKVYKLL